MRRHTHSETGESLVEILIALVIMGVVVASLFASYATASTASKNHRDLVTADAALRGYAELTKSAVRDSCIGAVTTYSVTYIAPPNSGLTPPPSVAGRACPPKTVSGTPLPAITLTVTMANGVTQSLAFVVRTP